MTGRKYKVIFYLQDSIFNEFCKEFDTQQEAEAAAAALYRAAHTEPPPDNGSIDYLKKLSDYQNGRIEIEYAGFIPELVSRKFFQRQKGLITGKQAKEPNKT